MKVAVLLALVAFVVAEDYHTTTTTTYKPTTKYGHSNGYGHVDRYNQHGVYEPSYEHRPVYAPHYAAPHYNVHNRYNAYAYQRYPVTGYGKQTYDYCNAYGYGSYMYNKCNKCARHRTYFTCPKEYYPSGYVAGSHEKHKTHNHDSYGTNTYKTYQPGYHFGKSQMFHFANKYDSSCYWQCDAKSVAIARPCPYGLVFDESVDVCVTKEY